MLQVVSPVALPWSQATRAPSQSGLVLFSLQEGAALVADGLENAWECQGRWRKSVTHLCPS